MRAHANENKRASLEFNNLRFYARLIDALATAPTTWNDASLDRIGDGFKRAD
jgi:hypothetical protein